MDAKDFTKGFIKENPVLVLMLGLCPTLAVTTGVNNAIGMGVATTAVLLGSNAVVALIKNLIPSKVRLPAFIVVIATFVSMTDMIMAAYFPELHKSLGLFIPLIVVNCIILGRAEAFASKNNILDSLIDAVSMGLGYTFALVLVSSFREILGTGKWWGMNILGSSFNPAIIMILPPGAFITLGLLLSFFNFMKIRNAQKEGDK